MACPLCSADRVSEYWSEPVRQYLRCGVCGLVFVPSRYFLSREDEKKRYDLHRNSPKDPGYRRFLNRLFIPLHERLAPGSSGLDFGSGPEPLLSRMFEEAGHFMTIHDPFYEPHPDALDRQYDFITASEVVEHLREPQKDLDRLWGCLGPGGVMGIMTQFLVEQDAFSAWHYKNDRTHVCFYAPPVFAWLAKRWNAKLLFPENAVILFQKRNGRNG